MIGRIKIIKGSGYGFITTPDETDYFFHQSQYKGDWEELKMLSPPNTTQGPEVQFKIIEHKRGPRAMKVELVLD